MEKIIMPIGYENKKVEKLSFVARKIERNTHYKRVYRNIGDFPFMPFERQNALVVNCLIHSAKNLDKRICKASQEDIESGFEKAFVNTAKESFVRFINGQDKGDIINQSWENALVIASDDKRKSNPLLLELCKASTKAINKYYSNGKKKHDDLMTVENTMLSKPFDNPENKAISECTKADIFAWLPKAKRANIIMFLDLQEYGYQIQEIAKIMNVSEKTLAEYKFEYACALAGVVQRSGRTW